MRLSVVVPCFNEEGNIGRVVAQAAEVGRDVAQTLEIVVVDDGSTDETHAVLRALQKGVPELKILVHPRNRGYGAAVRTGLRHATMEHVFLTDGDGQFDLAELPAALGLLGENDLVAGYRVDRSDGFWRRLWGKLWTIVVNRALGLGVRDANCAFKLLPQALLRSSDLQSDGALISAELLYEARRFDLRVAEVPVSHYPRASGTQTGASLRVIAIAFAELFGWMVRGRPAHAVMPSASDSTERATGLR